MKTAELGDEVKCKITGFKGIVTAYTKCLTGCDRVTVQPPLKKDGTYADAYNLDVASVEVIKEAKVKPASVQEDNGHGKKGGPATRAVIRRGV